MGSLFNTILYQPLFNGLIVLYQFAAFNDLGVAIILLTLVIRTLLFPLFYKGFKNQTLLQKIQPEIVRLQELHKHDKEKQATAMLELYKTHQVNPFASIFLLMIQLPILIALYKVFLNGFADTALAGLYAFIPNPGHIGSTFLGLIDLKEKSILLTILAAISQYYQGKLSLPQQTSVKNEQQQIGKTMVWVGPIITMLVLSRLPAAVGIYWLTSGAFSIGQQWYINKNIYGNGNSSPDNTTPSNTGEPRADRKEDARAHGV